jgi:nucleoside-diphosphate-sugar epimerase
MSLRVLVTGASGFLGSRLVRRLDRDGHDVIAVVRPGRSSALAGFGGRCIEQELSRPWPGPHPRRLDAVVYLAQSQGYREFPEKAPDMVAVGVQSLVHAAHLALQLEAGQFLFASSGSVYPRQFEPISETVPLAPGDFYARTKACGEMLLAAYADHLDLKIVRPFFPYGPGQSRRMLFPRLVRRVLEGRPITLEPSRTEPSETGGLRFSPIFVEDAVECLARLLELPGSATVNLASDEAVSIREVGAVIGVLAGRAPCFEVAPARRDGDLVADASALKRAVGPFVFTPLQKGLEALVHSMVREAK